MEIAVVKSSELGNRWDAEFHTAKQRLAPRAQEFEQDPAKTPESIVNGILSLSPSIWQYLTPLSRSNAARLDRAATLRIVQEYPYLALAILEENRHLIDAAARLKISKANQEIELIDQLISELDHPQGSTSNPRPKGF